MKHFFYIIILLLFTGQMGAINYAYHTFIVSNSEDSQLNCEENEEIEDLGTPGQNDSLDNNNQ